MQSSQSKTERFFSYFKKAIWEILFVTIGILIAVNINAYVKNIQDDQLRCTYLDELLDAFEYDIKDVEDNIAAFEEWNPKIHEIYDSLNSNQLEKVDSLQYKFGLVGNFIFFGQRSKPKIEELKYSSINLIENRELKNKIIYYQDFISAIRILESKDKLVSEDIRKYYTEHFKGYNYGPAIPLNFKKLKTDNYYSSLLYQRLKNFYNFESNYKRLLLEQNEIKELIIQEIEENCN